MSDSTASFLAATSQWVVLGCLLVVGAIFSGLFVIFIQLHPNNLRSVMHNGSISQKVLASRLLTLRANGNYLVCTLLIGNILANCSLAILLGQLIGGVFGIIGSTLAVVLVGNILPYALCGRHPLKAVAYTMWITWFFYVLLWPVAYPLSLVLDVACGEDFGILIGETTKISQERPFESPLMEQSPLQDGCVEEIMIPIYSSVMVEASIILDRPTIQSLRDSFYSRIPVYLDDKDNVIGVLLVHELLTVALNMSDGAPPPLVKEVMTPISPARFLERTRMHEALLALKGGDVQLAVVFNDKDHIVGIVTVNDLVEYALGTRLPDEKLIRRRNESQRARRISGFQPSRSTSEFEKYQFDPSQPLLVKARTSYSDGRPASSLA